MIDARTLPRLLEAAGIATAEQAAELARLIANDDAELAELVAGPAQPEGDA